MPAPLRIATTVLVLLLATVAIGAAAYGIVLAVARDPLPRTDQRVALPPLLRPPAPEHLPAAAEFGRRETPAAAAHPNEAVALQVVLPHMPPVPAPDAAGIAVYRADTGAEFRWLPLATAAHEPDGAVRVEVPVKRGQRWMVALAAAVGEARHGYFERREVKTPTQGTADVRVELNAVIATVRFDLPADAERAGPLRLQRVDDEQWVPMLLSGPGLTLQRGTTFTLQLGGGRYRLCDALRPERSQEFPVAQTNEVVALNPDLTRPRGDRP